MSPKKEKKIKKSKKDKKENLDKKKKLSFDFIKKIKLYLNRLKFKLTRKNIIIMSIGLIFVIGLIIGINYLNSMVKQKEQAHQKILSQDLKVIIPDGAFPSKKTFDIVELSKDSIEYQNLVSMANFTGKIYYVKPSDGKEESSLKPIIVRYKIPKKLYFGDNYTNFSLAYANDDDPPIISEFSGCRIVKDGNDYYIEAETFHLSKIGLIQKSPKEASYGLRTLVEKPPSIKNDIILVGGSDLNFSGYLSNTKTATDPYGKNLWSVLFPDRTIWKYNYPMVETKSKLYYDSFLAFLMRTGQNSYIEFEAKRLAQELKRLPNRTFDIIAHGVGGLIARMAIESDPDIKNVQNIVLISTPNKGTNIANPLFFNVLYGKNISDLSKTFGINERTMVSIEHNVNFYIEQINSYYKEIMPNSYVLKKLDSFGLRKDIHYMAIAGSVTGLNESIKGSILERFYPEFLHGDGIVTIDSALNDKFEKNLLFKKSFFEIYTDPKILDSIKLFLNSKVDKIVIKPFENDNFIETYKEKELAEKKELAKSYNFFKVPNSYSEKTFILKNNDYGVLKEDYIKIQKLKNKLFLETPNGVYNDKFEKILNVKVLGGIIYNGRYFISAPDGIYATDETGGVFVKVSNSLITSNEAYYLPNNGLITVFNEDMYSSVYLDNSLISNKFLFKKIKIIDKDVYFVFNNKISIINNGKLLTVLNKEDLINKGLNNFGDFIDFVPYKKQLFILTSDYKLIMYDTEYFKTQIIGNQDIGRLSLFLNNDTLLVFGKTTLTKINLKDRIFNGDYQKFKNEIEDVYFDNKTFYFITKTLRGNLLWDGKIN
ncbi:hypothetical protein OSSY52_20840 [Tepiditoga spiralis]|uniref:DUF676 domain-containing protein n=1 Tax=Tepiditoga spiralis TaxID=2108365 RepID=A0A7G1GA49_9BACT|nr:hypothetical protein [Tepiditoga spiralis]BBE31943.1 hypothetical protein OSSY52_20840 [Tepiditoga spiralis]